LRDADDPLGARPQRILAYSDRPLTVAGISELFREGRLAPAIVEQATDPQALEPMAGLRAAFIDLEAAGATEALHLARARSEAVIALIPHPGYEVDPAIIADADAILQQDELDPQLVALALAAARHAVRLVARELVVGYAQELSPAIPGALGAPGEASARALELLSEGYRDAEIALALNLSESATRKLIQRTVRRAGARTRCQAVAAAVRAGELA
jgi:DNA-binding NarL/FixJ family response regulator